MVKGLTRRVIIVDSPDPALFEQAIFIVRDGVFSREGATQEQVISQARQVARDCAQGRLRLRSPLAALGWTLLGAAGVGGLWLLTAFFL